MFVSAQKIPRSAFSIFGQITCHIKVLRCFSKTHPKARKKEKFEPGESVDFDDSKDTVFPGNSSSGEIIPVSSHLVLHKADEISSAFAPANKPLVVLFQWLYAKPAHVAKYCALYHDIGLDVLTVRGKLSHFLWPPESFKLSDELFSFVKGGRPADEKILIHAFSLGAYNYTISMKESEVKPEESGRFRDRVIGQIFDSIVIGTYDSMSKGIAETLPNNAAFRRVVLQTLSVYYNITRSTTKETYDELVRHFRENPIDVPTLMFYSQNDPMCDTFSMETMLSEWKLQRPGFDVARVSWPESIHAAHLKEHNQEYVAAWTELMTKLQLL